MVAPLFHKYVRGVTAVGAFASNVPVISPKQTVDPEAEAKNP